MDKKFDKAEDFDYTIVMDPRFSELFPKGTPAADAGAPAAATPATKTPEPEKPVIDPWERLYAEYEEMCLKEPTILDLDDAYPHSYQWRVGDRYDPAKIEVLKAALTEGKRISDTEAYQKYLEDFKNRRFEPVSWE